MRSCAASGTAMLEEQTDAGASGAVSRAWDERLARPVAVKVLIDARGGIGKK